MVLQMPGEEPLDKGPGSKPDADARQHTGSAEGCAQAVAEPATVFKDSASVPEIEFSVIFPRRKTVNENGKGQNGEPVFVTREFITPYFKMPMVVACAELGVCPTAMKKACRKLGIVKWPYRQTVAARSRRLSPSRGAEAAASNQEHQQALRESGHRSQGPPGMQQPTTTMPHQQPLHNHLQQQLMQRAQREQMLQQMQQGQMARWQMQKEVEPACGGSPPSLSPCMHALVLTHLSIQMQMNQMNVFGVNGGGLDDRGMFLRHDGMDNGGMGVPGMMPNRMMPNAQVHSNVAGMMTHNTMQGNVGAHRRPNMMGGVNGGMVGQGIGVQGGNPGMGASVLGTGSMLAMGGGMHGGMIKGDSMAGICGGMQGGMQSANLIGGGGTGELGMNPGGGRMCPLADGSGSGMVGGIGMSMGLDMGLGLGMGMASHPGMGGGMMMEMGGGVAGGMGAGMQTTGAGVHGNMDITRMGGGLGIEGMGTWLQDVETYDGKADPPMPQVEESMQAVTLGEQVSVQQQNKQMMSTILPQNQPQWQQPGVSFMHNGRLCETLQPSVHALRMHSQMAAAMLLEPGHSNVPDEWLAVSDAGRPRETPAAGGQSEGVERSVAGFLDNDVAGAFSRNAGGSCVPGLRPLFTGPDDPSREAGAGPSGESSSLEAGGFDVSARNGAGLLSGSRVWARVCVC